MDHCCYYWYSEIASVNVRQCTFGSLLNISLMVGPLCTILVNTWLCVAGSEHRHTEAFGLGIKMKLLHHCDVSSVPGGKIICCHCRCSSSFLKGSCSAYGIHWGRLCTVFHLLNPAMKIFLSITQFLKISTILIMHFFVILVLAAMSASFMGSAIKYQLFSLFCMVRGFIFETLFTCDLTRLLIDYHVLAQLISQQS